jgi:rod shape-determining protein MreD
MEQMMRKNVKWVMVSALAALLQSTWPDVLKLQDVLPEFALIVTAWFAITEGEERAMFTGVIGGLYLDVAGNTLLGHNVLCLVVAAFVTARISVRLITEHPAVKVALVFTAAVLHGILFTAILYVQKPDIGFLYRLISTVTPSCFYTALVSPLVFFLLGALFREKAPQRGDAI